MTRINLVPPDELMDQHLFAEFREIKMVPKALRRSLAAATARHGNDAYTHVLQRIPSNFTLNKGHVSFFYDKGEYLRDRFGKLCFELDRRGINYNRSAVLDDAGVFDSLPPAFNQHYVPPPEALQLVRDRIALRISERPGWYRYTATC